MKPTLVGGKTHNCHDLDAISVHARALELYERVAELQQRAFGENHESVATALTNAANVYFARGDYKHARATYERAMKIWNAVYPEGHPDVTGTLSNLAAVESRIGEYDSARRHLERAQAILESMVGPDHPDVPSVLTNLASVVAHTGDRERARALHRLALEKHERISPATSGWSQTRCCSSVP